MDLISHVTVDAKNRVCGVDDIRLLYPLTDERGVLLYKLVDGEIVKRTQDEMDADYIKPETEPSLESRVETLEGSDAEVRQMVEMLLLGVTEDE